MRDAFIYWCETLLNPMLDRSTGLFAFSTKLQNGQYTNVFDHPLALRYTVNTYAGLLQAQDRLKIFDNVATLFTRFLDNYQVTNPGDQGLLLLVLAENDLDRANHWFKHLVPLLNNRTILKRRPVQELCWLLWGLSVFSEKARNDQAANHAEKLWKLIHRDFFCRDSLFPFHQHQWYRKRFVSFGAVTYFLRACYTYARIFDDRYVQAIARELTQRLISQQGENGEWGWFYDVYRGQLVEWYPIFTVHQDAMAMLFLFPALDDGIAESQQAIERSFQWIFGKNPLARSMFRHTPPWIYRSIRRNEPFEAGCRLLRAWVHSVFHSTPSFAQPKRLTINPECRSYHIGWMLYVWSNRLDQLPSAVQRWLNNERTDSVNNG